MNGPRQPRIEPGELAPASAADGGAVGPGPVGPASAVDPVAATPVRPAGSMGAAARRWWQGLSDSERRLISIGAPIVLLVLVWLVAVRPALRTIDRAAVERGQLELQWQTMQSLAGEARELRAAPPVGRAQAVAALEAASARLGPAAKLSLQGDRAVLTLDGVGTAALRDWLAEARSGARARPVEANLSRNAKGYSGTLVVAVGGRP